LTSKAFGKRVPPKNHFEVPIAEAEMPYDVFINHSTAGKLTAYAICSELESIGIRCWILPRDLNIGTAWDQIADAVKCCRIMIVVLSDYASRSDRVERQLELAFNHSVIIIPFRTEPEPVISGPQPSLESMHWLDALTPEVAQRLRSLSNLVGGLVLRQKNDPLPVRTLTTGQEEVPNLTIDGFTEPLQRESPTDNVVLTGTAVAQSADSDSGMNALPTVEPADANESVGMRPALKQAEKTSRRLLTKALLLTLAPFAIICAVGLLHANKGPGSVKAKPQAAASASIAPPVAVKFQHLDKFAASNPGWGTLDANWTVADDKLQVTPLLNSSAVLINHKAGFTDAEISAEVVMSKGQDLDQLGGLVFWAKDYNDCYALVVSADGKFALGRKLVGRWINPIAKTGNAAVKTGIGQTNKLRVRTEGSLLTAFINETQVANLAGEAPQGIAYIGLYGESGETTQNVWEFGNVAVTSVR